MSGSTAPGILVRACTEADAAAVRAVDASATSTLRRTYRPNAKALASKRSRLAGLRRIGAFRAGALVGCLEYRVEDDAMHVIGLGVHEDARRQGVARHLLEYVAGLARELGLARLSLSTVTETGNVPIFERLGFVSTSTEPDDFVESPDGRRLTVTAMQRRL